VQEKIVGTVMPVLELTLDPGESIFAESGELSWMSESIAMATTTQTGGGGGAFGALRRMAGGSSLFMTAYMAQGAPGMVAFAAKLPGQIFPSLSGPGRVWLQSLPLARLAAALGEYGALQGAEAGAAGGAAAAVMRGILKG